jgi:5-amino-6-(5-phosphoribosylamino)uracil reductase
MASTVVAGTVDFAKSVLIRGVKTRSLRQEQPVAQRPYVLLSAAASVDGFIDDAAPGRLVLSDAADLDRVDEVRAGADAILVGAGTIRADNPRLLVRSAARRAARQAAGKPASPVRVTLTGSGDLDPAALFFTAEAQAGGGPGGRIVYAAPPVLDTVRARVGPTGADVVGAGPGGLDGVLADLARRGIGRLMVEGGTGVLTGFLTGGLADELQLLVAPFFAGGGARLAGAGVYPHGPAHPMRLAGVARMGDAVLLRYALRGRQAEVP